MMVSRRQPLRWPSWLLSAVLLSVGAAHAATTDDAQSLSIIKNSEVIGSIVARTHGHVTEVDYRVDDNGRGPKHHERIELDKSGLPLAWTVHGTSLMGGPVDESYQWRGGRATWRSQADHGEVAAARPLPYVVNDGSPWASGVYARSLLKAPGQALPALPGGRLQLDTLRKLSVGEGSAAVATTVYRLSGVQLEPRYLMLDEQQHLFAEFSPQDVVVRQGYETQAPMLLKLAGELEMQHARELQQRLSHNDPRPLRVANVHVFDPATGQRSTAVSVLVRDGRIAVIEPGDAVAARDGERVYDGQGGTLIPGLHDMHSHTTLASGLWYLAAGVTSTRDMGNRNEFLLDLIPRIDSGELAGPRIVRNGFLEGRSPYSERTGFVVDSELDALDKVRWYKNHGYWQIKIYNSMNPDWVPAIAAEAHRLGMRVTGHIPAFTTPDKMIAAGYDEITHINQLMLGWLLDPGEDTRTPLRLTAMVRAKSLDLDAPNVRHTMELMHEHHIPIDPTAVIVERLMLSRSGEVAEGDAPYLSHMPIGYQRYRKRTFIPDMTPQLDKDYRAAFKKTLEVIGRLHRQGTQLLPGTDDTTGFTVQRELELYVQAGMTPAEALRAGTLDCERYFGRDDQLGSTTVGKRADFVLLAGDPTTDISAIRQARMVVKDSQLYFPAEIYRALGVAPFASAPEQVR